MNSEPNIPAMVPETTVVNPDEQTKQYLELYHLLELDCILRTKEESEAVKKDIEAAIENNRKITSNESMEELEKEVSLVTITSLKMQQVINDRQEELRKAKEELSRLPVPSKSIEDLRKEKHDWILNYSKKVQDRVDEVRKEREAEQEKKYLELEKERQQLQAELLELDKVKEQDEDTDGDHPEESGLNESDDSDDEIAVLDEKVPVPQLRQWEKSLASKIKEIEEMRDKINRGKDEVERIKSRLGEGDNPPSTSKTRYEEDITSTPSTSKTHVPKFEPKQERTTPSPGNEASCSSGSSSSRRETPRRGKAMDKTPARSSGGTSSKTVASRRSSRVKSVEEVEVSD